MLATCTSTLLTAVSATWNGEEITGPKLIYHDEIRVDPGLPFSLGDANTDGALFCESRGRPRASWRRADGATFLDSNNDGYFPSDILHQLRTTATSVPSLARLSRVRDNMDLRQPHQNGLWTCRTQVVPAEGPEGLQTVLSSFVFVALYRRGKG